MVTLKLKPRQRVAAAVGVMVAVLVMLAGLGLELAYADNVPPRVKIGTIAIGGMTRDQAKRTLQQGVERFKAQPVEVSFADNHWPITTTDLGATFEIDKTLDQLFGAGSHLKFLVLGSKSGIVIRFDDKKLQDYFEKIAKVTDTPSVDATLKITETEIVELPEKVGRGFDRELLKETLQARLSRLDHSPVNLTMKDQLPKVYRDGLPGAKQEAEQLLNQKLTAHFEDLEFKIGRKEITEFIVFEPSSEPLLSGIGNLAEVKLSDDKIREWVKKVAKKIDQPLKDARLKLEGDRVSVFTPSQEGRTLDKDKTVQLVSSKLLHGEDKLELPVELKKPTITTESVNDLGIKELIGKGTTSFKGSPQNRKHNIGNGTRFLNGILIRPGEVFSVVEQLGQIDDTSGYLPELVIRENKTIPEFGGGLCQVSTTLFRAALNSGLPITERQNHSWRIRYYEPPVGLDATVYLPKPDLKIKNDTPGWVLIQGFVQGDNLTFEFYGTKDGRRAELIGPKLLSSTPPPPDEYVETADLPERELKEVEKPHAGGKATVTYRVYDKDGKLINDQTFNSSYKAVPRRFLKGTGPKPPESAPAEPNPAPQPEQPAPPPTQ